jgi:hypothetical protein
VARKANECLGLGEGRQNLLKKTQWESGRTSAFVRRFQRKDRPSDSRVVTTYEAPYSGARLASRFFVDECETMAASQNPQPVPGQSMAQSPESGLVRVPGPSSSRLSSLQPSWLSLTTASPSSLACAADCFGSIYPWNYLRASSISAVLLTLPILFSTSSTDALWASLERSDIASSAKTCWYPYS